MELGIFEIFMIWMLGNYTALLMLTIMKER